MSRERFLLQVPQHIERRALRPADHFGRHDHIVPHAAQGERHIVGEIVGNREIRNDDLPNPSHRRYAAPAIARSSGDGVLSNERRPIGRRKSTTAVSRIADGASDGSTTPTVGDYKTYGHLRTPWNGLFSYGIQGMNSVASVVSRNPEMKWGSSSIKLPQPGCGRENPRRKYARILQRQLGVSLEIEYHDISLHTSCDRYTPQTRHNLNYCC